VPVEMSEPSYCVPVEGVVVGMRDSSAALRPPLALAFGRLALLGDPPRRLPPVLLVAAVPRVAAPFAALTPVPLLTLLVLTDLPAPLVLIPLAVIPLLTPLALTAFVLLLAPFVLMPLLTLFAPLMLLVLAALPAPFALTALVPLLMPLVPLEATPLLTLFAPLMLFTPLLTLFAPLMLLLTTPLAAFVPIPFVPLEPAPFTLAPLAALVLLAAPLIEVPFFIEEAPLALTDFADPRNAAPLTPLPAAPLAAFTPLPAPLEAALTLAPLVATPLTVLPLATGDFLAIPFTPLRAALDPPREATLFAEPPREAAPLVELALAFPRPLALDAPLAAGRAVFALLLAPFEADFADLAALDAPLTAVLPPVPLLACLVAAFFVAFAILMGFK
jgi:hypothetical protein